MKPVRVISPAFLFLVLGIAVPVCAQTSTTATTSLTAGILTPELRSVSRCSGSTRGVQPRDRLHQI
jgi:hypothetical protein